jgi:hypothetical protein
MCKRWHVGRNLPPAASVTLAGETGAAASRVLTLAQELSRCSTSLGQERDTSCQTPHNGRRIFAGHSGRGSTPRRPPQRAVLADGSPEAAIHSSQQKARPILGCRSHMKKNPGCPGYDQNLTKLMHSRRVHGGVVSSQFRNVLIVEST